MDTAQPNLLFYKDQHSVDHIMQLIHYCGYRNVSACDNLQEVSQILLTTNIDLVVITKLDDLKNTIATFIRQGEDESRQSKLPLVVITQNESVASIQKLIAQGVDYVLIEPVNQQLLHEKLEQLLSISQYGVIGADQLATAQHLIVQKKWDEAIVILQDLTDFPDIGAQASAGLCKAYIAKKDAERANSTLKKLTAIAKTSNNEAERQAQLSYIAYLYGDIHNQRGMTDKALEQYLTAYDLHPYNVDNLIRLIELLPRESKISKLEEILNNTVFDFLSFSTPLDQIAAELSKVCTQLQQLGLEEEAKSLFDILLKIDHKDARIHQQVLYYCVNQGDYSLLLGHAKYIIEMVKEPELFYNLAKNLLDIDSGKIEFSPKQTDSETPPAKQNIGAEDKKQLLQLAKNAIQQVVFWQPDTPKHRVLLAIAEFRLGNENTTISILQQVKEQFQDNLDEYTQVIRDLLDEKIYKEALNWLDSADEYFPDNEDILKLKADYYCCVGEPLKAVRSVKTYLMNDPQNVELIIRLGEIYLQAKDRNNALVFFEKAKKIAPNDPDVIEQLKKLSKR